jgi:SAM-dependent methyltransferase
MSVLVWRLVKAGVLIGATYAFVQQCRRPTGWLGRRIARAMNVGHGALTAWGLQQVRVEADSRVLDIGCGGGETIRTIAAMASAGHVDGVDYSSASVAVAETRNADLISAGRVAVQHASVSRLPFADRTFDVAVAVETHYYRPDLTNDFREVWRVLKPGGQFVLIAEAFKGRRLDFLFRPMMQVILRSNYLSLEEHRMTLVAAGFTDVRVEANQSRTWMRATAQRPLAG